MAFVRKDTFLVASIWNKIPTTGSRSMESLGGHGRKRLDMSKHFPRCSLRWFCLLVWMIIAFTIQHQSYPVDTGANTATTTKAKTKTISDRIEITKKVNVPTNTSVTSTNLGAIVFLAPQRHESSMWGLDRFCMLLRAVRSVDQHLNRWYGPYPIYILVSQDYELDPRGKDGRYTLEDRDLIRRWAPSSPIIEFIEIPLYSQDALEPNTDAKQIQQWRQGKDGAVAGRDLGYTSMCRLWSGRLQTMEFLDAYTYYMRMDDDSLLLRDMPFDPFQRMAQSNIIYAYRRQTTDMWGISKLWEVSKPHLQIDTTTAATTKAHKRLPFTNFNGGYSGDQPYNNFHISRVDFWRSPQWQALWKDMNAEHVFFKYRVGDANVHAIAVMMMATSEPGQRRFEAWPEIPYVHNSNDFPSWGSNKTWNEECTTAYEKYLKKG